MFCKWLIYDKIVEYEGDCYDGTLSFERDGYVLQTAVTRYNNGYMLNDDPSLINELMRRLILRAEGNDVNLQEITSQLCKQK